MKLTTLIFILFSTYYSIAQKSYQFNYFIEYEMTFYKEDSIKKQVIYLTNSKDNSYFAEITSLDSLNYQLIFIHQDKIYSNVIVLKSDLYKAEFINIPCDAVNHYENKFKRKTKEYDYFILNDTLIDQKKYAVYKFKSILEPKKRKRNHAGTNLYIIDMSTNFHIPILTHSTAYEEWKQKKNLPNGIYMEKKFINHLEEEHSSEKLISYEKIDKKIIIPSECDYSK